MSDTTIRQTKFTPPQVAKMWGIAAEKVIRWIRSGELPAMDASTKRNERPRWLIDIADLREFERRRRYAPPRRPVRRSRRQDTGEEYY